MTHAIEAINTWKWKWQLVKGEAAVDSKNTVIRYDYAAQKSMQ